MNPESYTVEQREEIFQLAEKLAAYVLQTKESFPNPADTMRFLKLRYFVQDFEEFGALWLDGQHGLIAVEILASGTIDTANVYPREVVKAAIKQRAKSVIFFHNHPSGDLTPSSGDKLLTAKLKEALSLIDVRVLDHVIVGMGEAMSFAEKGLL